MGKRTDREQLRALADYLWKHHNADAQAGDLDRRDTVETAITILKRFSAVPRAGGPLPNTLCPLCGARMLLSVGVNHEGEQVNYLCCRACGESVMTNLRVEDIGDGQG